MISKKSLVMIGIIASSALILSACSMQGGSTNTGTGQTGGTPQSQVNESPVPTNMITYSDKGFSPASIKVKVGEAVNFKNNSTGDVQVQSDPHPTHTLYPELNIGVIASGETKSTSFAKAGTYTYHNHLSPSQKGEIVVE